MNPVCEHLLRRRHKKVPVKDRKRMVLILFGGLMRGVRGGGVMVALEEMGLSYSFDDIYSVSAGFCNASYLLSNQASLGNSIYYKNLQTKRFINYARLWNVVDMDYVIDLIKRVKKLNIKSIYAQRTRLWIRLFDEGTQRHKFLEVHDVPEENYLQVMRAGISIPYLNPGSVKIKEREYKDSDFTLPDITRYLKEVFSRPGTDFVIVYSDFDQYQYAHSKLKYLGRTSKNILEIIPQKEWKLSRFETDTQKLKKEARRMGRLFKKQFGLSKGIKLYK